MLTLNYHGQEYTLVRSSYALGDLRILMRKANGTWGAPLTTVFAPVMEDYAYRNEETGLVPPYFYANEFVFPGIGLVLQEAGMATPVGSTITDYDNDGFEYPLYRFNEELLQQMDEYKPKY